MKKETVLVFLDKAEKFFEIKVSEWIEIEDRCAKIEGGCSVHYQDETTEGWTFKGESQLDELINELNRYEKRNRTVN